MSQILHILKKDIRCFRLEIVMVFLSAVVSVRNSISDGGPSQPEAFTALFWITGTLLISRVIHAEAIPGTRLNWLTRPYRWKSLLAEKLLFLFLFVGLPPAMVMLVSLEVAGFSLREYFPSLLFLELMIFVVWIVPVAALAAVTESLPSFFVGLLFVGALGAVLSGLLYSSPANRFPNAIVWVPASLSALILICGAVVILYIQYRQRRTVIGRACAAVSAILGVVMAVFTPFALGMQVQSLFSRERIDHSSMVVSVENKLFSRDFDRDLLLELKGTPAGFDAHVDALVGAVVGSDGEPADLWMRDILPSRPGPARISRILAQMTDSDIARLRGKPVTIRGSVYVTLKAATSPRPWQLSAAEGLEAVVNGVRCGRTPNGYAFTCRAMLGSPLGALSFQPVGEPHILTLDGSSSYWPFPSLDLSPYEEKSVGRQSQARSVDFFYTEPVSHFRLNFDIPVARFLE